MVVRYTPPDIEDSDIVLTQQIDLAVGRSGLRVGPKSDSDDHISDRVLLRLWLARQLALLRAEGYQLRARA